MSCDLLQGSGQHLPRAIAHDRIEPEPAIDWLAHSFLAVLHRDQSQWTSALLGFSWGFSILDGNATLHRTDALDAAAWDGHRPLLAEAHPSWTFTLGFHG